MKTSCILNKLSEHQKKIRQPPAKLPGSFVGTDQDRHDLSTFSVDQDRHDLSTFSVDQDSSYRKERKHTLDQETTGSQRQRPSSRFRQTYVHHVSPLNALHLIVNSKFRQKVTGTPCELIHLATAYTKMAGSSGVQSSLYREKERDEPLLHPNGRSPPAIREGVFRRGLAAFIPWPPVIFSHLPALEISPFCMACTSACLHIIKKFPSCVDGGIDAMDVATANIGRNSLIPSRLSPIENTGSCVLMFYRSPPPSFVGTFSVDQDRHDLSTFSVDQDRHDLSTFSVDQD
ncbi:unnamed protein product, partial [Cyprideis torosa]